MSHSVERHLAVHVHDYDGEIRKFVPQYDQMLDAVADAVSEHLPKPDARVLDLGAGTGSLAHRLATRFEQLLLVLLDADAEMLSQAKKRLEAFTSRVEFVEGSFPGVLPKCDLAVASLSLHHLFDPVQRQAAHRAIYESLPSGGVLVNADAMVPTAAELSEPLMKRWAAHLVAHGDTEAQAFERFAQWAHEDKYFGVEQELAWLKAAGFEQVDVRWRGTPTCVLLARKR
jgi:tRNA (cmo5U34)-methyltransferase